MEFDISKEFILLGHCPKAWDSDLELGYFQKDYLINTLDPTFELGFSLKDLGFH